MISNTTEAAKDRMEKQIGPDKISLLSLYTLLKIILHEIPVMLKSI